MSLNFTGFFFSFSTGFMVKCKLGLFSRDEILAKETFFLDVLSATCFVCNLVGD